MNGDWPNALFVGRERELEWLIHQTRGYGRTVVVTGDRGVGKTALVSRYLYGLEQQPWVRWELHPDPISLEALYTSIDSLYARTDRTEIVVIDNAEIRDETASEIVNRVLNLKRIRAVILVSSRRLNLPHAKTLVLKGLPTHLPVEGSLYELQRGLLVPERKLIADLKPRILLANESLAERLQRTPHSVFDLSPRQFEELVADLLHDLGYEVHVTPATRDGGKDILAYLTTPLGRILCLVEAKRYRQDRVVGVGLVRQLYGTLADAGATNAMLVTTSSFSKDARAFRQKHEYRLDLKDYANVVQWIRDYGQSRL